VNFVRKLKTELHVWYERRQLQALGICICEFAEQYEKSFQHESCFVCDGFEKNTSGIWLRNSLMIGLIHQLLICTKCVCL